MSKETVKDYDPNKTFDSVHTVELIFAMWSYKRTEIVNIKSNGSGMWMMECAVSSIYESLPENLQYKMPYIILKNTEGDELTCEDDDNDGEEWLKDMLISARFISFKKSNRENG